MRGQPTTCHICGHSGPIYGCPGWYDVCVNEAACRDRAIGNVNRNKDREIESLKKQLEAK